MPIPVTCSQCNSKLQAPDAAAGKRVKCPKCGAAIEVASATTEEAAGIVPAPPPIPTTPTHQPIIPDLHADDEEFRPRRKPRRDDEDDHGREDRRDDDDRPRRRIRRDVEPAGTGLARWTDFS